MLVSPWMVSQFVLLTLSIAPGPHNLASAMQVLLLVIVGALILAPLIPACARALVRTLSLTPNAPPRPPLTRAVRSYRIPNDPGPSELRLHALRRWLFTPLPERPDL